MTFAGAGLAFFGGSPGNLNALRTQLTLMTIGPDKVNQLRHVRWLQNMEGVAKLMEQQAALIKPKFDCVLGHLETRLANSGLGEWTRPRGGYFISFNTRPGLAKAVVALAASAGVKLTPAGCRVSLWG